MNIRTLKRGLKRHSLVVLLGIYLILISIYNTVGIIDSVLWDCFYYTVEFGVIYSCLLAKIRDVSFSERLIRVGVVSYKMSLMILIYIAAWVSSFNYDVFRDNMGNNVLCLIISLIIAVILLTILKKNKRT